MPEPAIVSMFQGIVVPALQCDAHVYTWLLLEIESRHAQAQAPGRGSQSNLPVWSDFAYNYPKIRHEGPSVTLSPAVLLKAVNVKFNPGPGPQGEEG